jgi:hypothetical protein
MTAHGLFEMFIAKLLNLLRHGPLSPFPIDRQEAVPTTTTPQGLQDAKLKVKTSEQKCEALVARMMKLQELFLIEQGNKSIAVDYLTRYQAGEDERLRQVAGRVQRKYEEQRVRLLEKKRKRDERAEELEAYELARLNATRPAHMMVQAAAAAPVVDMDEDDEGEDLNATLEQDEAGVDPEYDAYVQDEELNAVN